MEFLDLSMWQILLLTALAGISIIDQMTFTLGLGAVSGIIGVSVLAGVVVGNPLLGLLVGGLFQSYAMGINMFGGTAIPNWAAAAILVTGLSGNVDNVATAAGIIGVPVAALTVQMDIFGRFANVVFQHRGDRYAASGDGKQVLLSNTLGLFCWTISRMLPVLIGLVAGPIVLQTVQGLMPSWLSGGLIAISRLLPAVGLAVLLRFLPTKQLYPYLIIGFVLVAWFKVPVLAVSAIGLAVAVVVFQSKNEQSVKAIDIAEGGGFDE